MKGSTNPANSADTSDAASGGRDSSRRSLTKYISSSKPCRASSTMDIDTGGAATPRSEDDGRREDEPIRASPLSSSRKSALPKLPSPQLISARPTLACSAHRAATTTYADGESQAGGEGLQLASS
mmetsp:Transcript_12698/g.38801  ORF Transcript_12698/g.38801 Transcript_12698/m.38801 type:complete len:125 (-) Transcript_12698:30-404(-)|eukprot:scaffold200511_cov29-Tisochrysis_lutea.AAC.4